MILVCVCALAESCSTVITLVILVCICTLAESCSTVITLVILICICTLAESCSTVVALVILISICTLAENCSAKVTLVILVCVCALAKSCSAVVTLVILVCICTFAELCSAVVTVVILICVCTLAENCITDVTLVILVFICTLAENHVAEITVMIIVIVYVLAGNAQCLEDLSSDVLCSAYLCIADVNVVYVAIESSVYERMDRSKICYRIQYVVCFYVYSAAGNSDLCCKSSLDHIVNNVCLCNCKSYEIGHRDSDRVHVCLGDLSCESVYVSVASVNESGDKKLCVIANGKLDAEHVVYCGVVLAKRYVYERCYGNVDLKILDRCECLNYLKDFSVDSRTVKSARCKSLCYGEGDIREYEFNVYFYVEAVVVTQYSYCCIRVKSVDSKHCLRVVLVVRNELVQCGIYCKINDLSYGNVDGVVCVIAKLIVEVALLEVCDKIRESKLLCVIPKKSNYVYCLGVGVGKTCFGKSCCKDCAKLVYVCKVLFSYESYPIKLGYCCVSKKIGNCYVKSAVKRGGYVIHTLLGKDILECVCKICIEICSEFAVNVLTCKAYALSKSKVKSAAAVVCNGDEACTSDVLCGYFAHCNHLVLICAEVESVYYEICICLVAVNYCEIEGILRECELACHNVSNVVTDSCVDLLCGCVSVYCDAVELCELSGDASVDLFYSRSCIYNDVVHLSDLCCDLSVCLLKNVIYSKHYCRNYLVDNDLDLRYDDHAVYVDTCLDTEYLKVFEMCIEVVLESENCVNERVNVCYVTVCKSCLELFESCNYSVELVYDVCLAYVGHCITVKVYTLYRCDSCINCCYCCCNVTVFKSVCITKCISVVVVLGNEDLESLNCLDESVYDHLLADIAVILKNCINYSYDSCLVCYGEVFSVEDLVVNVLSECCELILGDLLTGCKHSVYVVKKVICLSVCEIACCLKSELDILNYRKCGDSGNLYACVDIAICKSAGYLFDDSDLILSRNIFIEKDILNDLFCYVCDLLFTDNLVFNEGLNYGVEDSKDLLICEKLSVREIVVEILDRLHLGGRVDIVVILENSVNCLNDSDLSCGGNCCKAGKCLNSESARLGSDLGDSKNVEVDELCDSANLCIGYFTVDDCKIYVSNDLHNLLVGYEGIESYANLFNYLELICISVKIAFCLKNAVNLTDDSNCGGCIVTCDKEYVEILNELDLIDTALVEFVINEVKNYCEFCIGYVVSESSVELFNKLKLFLKTLEVAACLENCVNLFNDSHCCLCIVVLDKLGVKEVGKSCLVYLAAEKRCIEIVKNIYCLRVAYVLVDSCVEILKNCKLLGVVSKEAVYLKNVIYLFSDGTGGCLVLVSDKGSINESSKLFLVYSALEKCAEDIVEDSDEFLVGNVIVERYVEIVNKSELLLVVCKAACGLKKHIDLRDKSKYLRGLIIFLELSAERLKIVYSLFVSGVLFLVSSLDDLKELVVSCRSGVNGHTVTNLEKSVDLAHGRSVFTINEPINKRLIYSNRTGALRKLFGHVAERLKDVVCNTVKAFNCNLGSINVCNNSLFNCKIYCD